MRNNSLLRTVFISLCLALPAPILLVLLLEHGGRRLLPEGVDTWFAHDAAGLAYTKTALLFFVLLWLASLANDYLRRPHSDRSAQDNQGQPARGRNPQQQHSIHVADRDDLDDAREEGIVKWFNVNKGFGFIIRDTGGEVFVHFRAIRGTGHRTLREGQRVRFSAVEGEKGLQAEDVSIVA